ncbi:MAG TPA: hypothetical protein VKK81_15690 [Candidatus Binatia bacterium]|nr:hypothetical protein [Candidatus Binatia bacterium]
MMATGPLDEFQKEILEREVRAFLTGVADPDAQARYAGLLQEVEDGEVSEEFSPALEGILAVILESGRARKLYGPAGENTLTTLFQKTPRGSALVQQANEVNKALKGLEGQTLGGISFRSIGPGSWGLTLQTDRGELTLRIDRQGIRVHDLEVDLG